LETFRQNKPSDIKLNLLSSCRGILVKFEQKFVFVLMRDLEAVKEVHPLPHAKRLTSDRVLSEDFSVPDFA